MNSSLLTQLGCAGSIILALSLGNAAATQAETEPTRVIVFSSSSQTSIPITVSSEQNNQEQANISDNQSIEQNAIDRFGCDCSGCQNQILQSQQTL